MRAPIADPSKSRFHLTNAIQSGDTKAALDILSSLSSTLRLADRLLHRQEVDRLRQRRHRLAKGVQAANQ